VVANLVHVEEADAKALARAPADLFDGGLQAFQRKVLEEVVDKAEIEGFVRRRDFKHVADGEADAREECAGVLDVLGAEIEPGIAHQPRQPIGVEEAVVVGRATSGLQHRESSAGVPA
jgi:hypothetical protein